MKFCLLGITPYCRNCAEGWMGTSCQTACGPEHGRQVPMDSGVCQCDACYHGISCDQLCGGQGNCTSGDSAMCDCTDDQGLNGGWWGDFCDQPNCPGIGMYKKLMNNRDLQHFLNKVNIVRLIHGTLGL